MPLKNSKTCLVTFFFFLKNRCKILILLETETLDIRKCMHGMNQTFAAWVKH